MIFYAFINKPKTLEFTIYVIWTIIIIKHKDTFFNSKILGSKIMVFIGRISYSVYMWHYGIIMLVGKDLPHVAIVVTIIGVLVYPIENILRVSKHRLTVPFILGFGLVLLIISITVRFS